MTRPAWWVTRNEKGDVISEGCHLVTCPNYSYLGQCVHASASSQTRRMSIACAHETVAVMVSLVKHEQGLLRDKWGTDVSCLGQVLAHDLAMGRD